MGIFFKKYNNYFSHKPRNKQEKKQQIYVVTVLLKFILIKELEVDRFLSGLLLEAWRKLGWGQQWPVPGWKQVMF